MVASGGNEQQPLPKNKNNKGSSFDAFSKVDELVSKPVLGSDGAASWQAFRNRKDNRANTNNSRHYVSVAPKAPLKKQDKLGTGFSTWEEERAHEGRVREAAGHAGTNAGYTAFQSKNKNKSASEEAAISRKRKAQVEARIRPADKEFFIQSNEFVGWKFDYVFTTKNGVTGYYWDGMDSVKVQRGESLPETKTDRVSLSSSSSSSGVKHIKNSNSNSNSNSDAPNKDKPKKKRKKKKGPVIVHDPNNPMEQMQAILQRRNQKLMGITTPTDNDLPSGWEAAEDPSTGKIYYFQRATGQRTWDKPKTTSAAESTEGEGNGNGATGESLPPGWKSTVDRASGKTYYHHTNGKTTWTKPE